MNLILFSSAVTLCGIILVLLLPLRLKKNAALTAVVASGILNFSAAFTALKYGTLEIIFNCGFPFRTIPFRIDSLGAFFIIVINITLITGCWYGFYYMKMYTSRSKDPIHWTAFLVLQASMTAVCVTQNVIAFLMFWEVMTVSGFMLIIYENEKRQTLRAGINYFIQSHIGVLLLITAFIWTSASAGSYDMQQIMNHARLQAETLGPWPFILLFTGFAFKAGFVPLHTWLPWAHPAAPAHVSGVMSGVIIKMGIFGIFRILPLCQGKVLETGRLILILSICTALYGVMVAIVQHNLKRLLAYHSIENIGIIGMGIGLGLMGTGMGNSTIAMAGYCGALLHTLNHSLFKSLLFYSTGSVYRKSHTVIIEELGGIMKYMPFTAGLFLVSALAITGLPPFNGFISEFLIYSSMYSGLTEGALPVSMIMLCCIFGLVMVGGLAFLCFTKAFGIVFLGTPRRPLPEECSEVENMALVPQVIVLCLIVCIGVFPAPFVRLVSIPAAVLLKSSPLPGVQVPSTWLMHSITMSGIILILLTVVIMFVRMYVIKRSQVRHSPVWGCGYTGADPKVQYTATSFVQTYTNIASPILKVHSESPVLKGMFPEKGSFRTHAFDKVEDILVDSNMHRLGRLMTVFGFLQNGLIQYYILYGVIFITAILAFTFRQSIFSFIISFLALG